MAKSIGELLLGRPLRSEEQRGEAIGTLAGVPVLGLDALASAAYGPEAALTVLIPAGAAAAAGYVEPISAVIVVVLMLVFFSYRQTIAAYPGGGGSYTVARENLGAGAGLAAAAALTLDYVLNVAVAISAGVGAIVSAVPALLPHTLELCLALLALLTLVNVRGVREAGILFMVPTYLFVATLGGVLVLGVARTVAAGGHPVPVVHPPAAARTGEAASLWLVLRAFASGCTAMTGVEAVSNGVPLFREPRVAHARRTLAAIVLVLAALLLGIALVGRAYGIVATPPGERGYQSVLSQLVGAVAGRGVFYYVTLAAVFAVLSLSANTSFAGFPRLCRMLALDEYLPAEFAHLGRRLVYTRGIVVLTLLAGVLLVVFGGVTDRLIPLFAIGAFLAFTLSQAGMVAHWRRVGGRHAVHSRVVNAAGAIATGVTLMVVAASKFAEGAWITLVLIPGLVVLFLSIRRYYDGVERETAVSGPLMFGQPPPPVIVVPLKSLDKVARKALRMAVTLSPDVEVLHIHTGAPDVNDLAPRWAEWVEAPMRAAGFAPPRLVRIESSYREFFGPLLRHVRELQERHPDRYVAVMVPELVENRWYSVLLSGNRAALLKGLLLFRGGRRVIVINTPWYRHE